MDASLKNKIFRGTLWIAVSKLATQAAALIKNIVIARVLSPDDFGLFGIALIVLSFFTVFSQTGINEALIQNKKDVDEYLHTAFAVNMLRGAALFTLLFFAAPLVATFFGDQSVTNVVRAIGFTFLIKGFYNPGTVVFSKELDFQRQFYWEISGSITDIIVSLSIVLYLKNVWVLVIANLSSATVMLIVSYFLHPYRPKLSFEKRYAASLLSYGKWIWGSSIVIFLLNQGDDIFLGKMLGVTMLGFYQMAYTISNLPATEISGVVSQITFPTYSKLQDNIDELTKGFLNALMASTFLSVPLTVLIIGLASSFTRLFLGEKWLPMLPALKVLAVWGLVRAIGTPHVSLFRGSGHPKIDTYLQLARLIVLAIIIYPFTVLWGLEGVALAVLVSALVLCLPQMRGAMNLINATVYEYITQILPPVLNGIVMYLAIVGMQKILASPVGVLEFFVVIVVSVFVYLVGAYVIERLGFSHLGPIVRGLLRGAR